MHVLSQKMLCMAIAILSLMMTASRALPVFPGAEGFASDITAGRGGKIIKVTNIKDSGPGSLREAIGRSGKRIVVFEVGGVLKTGNDFTIRNGDLTIAGETAPYPGFTVVGAEFNITGKNILIRHLAIRVGKEYCTTSKGKEKDAVNLWKGASKVYLDHLSCTWANDETMSLQTSGGCGDVTFRHCIIAEGMLDGNHWKGPHNMGSVIGASNKNVSIIGCMYSTLGARNPLIRGGASCIMLNTLIYNCKNFGTTCESAGASVRASLVGNVYKGGPACALRTSGHPDHKLGWINYATGGESKIYFKDCVGVPFKGERYAVSPPPSKSAVSDPSQAVWTNGLTVLPSSKTEEWVLANVGMRPKDRENVDARLVGNAVKQTGNLITNETDGQVGGYPEYAMTTRTLQLPSNPHGDDDTDGYTNIEEMLHTMAAAIEPGGRPSPVKINVAKSMPSQSPPSLSRMLVSIMRHSSVRSVAMYSIKGTRINRAGANGMYVAINGVLAE